MKIEDHLSKVNSLKNSISKLDPDEDYEAIVELCMLVSAHLVNATLHQIGVLRMDRDLKHNKLAGEIKKRYLFGGHSEEISRLINDLEKLRPRHVYGTGRNGDTGRRAIFLCKEIERLCEVVKESA